MKDSKRKKRDGRRNIYRTLFTYALIIGLVRTAIQIPVSERLKTADILWQNVVYSFINTVEALLIIAAVSYICYRSLKKIIHAIEKLSEGGEVSLPEEGLTADIARSINATSNILKEQREIIEKRDNARADWIRGVSHDIRTPLSIIMGYSERLEDDELIGAGGRRYAGIIKEQSIRIRDLIEDLNLTMKLEYNKQPVRTGEFFPASLLRECVANSINSISPDCEGASEKYDIELITLPEFEKEKAEGDIMLIKRVFDNILTNALRHNPNGCHVLCLAYRTSDSLVVEMQDDGKGIPEEVASVVNSFGSELLKDTESRGIYGKPAEPGWAFTKSDPEENADSGNQNAEDKICGRHIMGLRIAKKIMLSHGGNLIIKPDRHTVELIFPAERRQ